MAAEDGPCVAANLGAKGSDRCLLQRFKVAFGQEKRRQPTSRWSSRSLGLIAGRGADWPLSTLDGR